MPDALAFPGTLPFSAISTKHDDWDGSYLARLRAFYKGGKALLNDSSIMTEIFPRHRNEKDKVYEERRKCSVYVPLAGMVLNFIKASLTEERLAVDLTPPDGSTDAPPTPDWYRTWFDDVSPPGGKTVPLHDFVGAAILEGLICKTAWARVDMPKPEEFTSLAEQERSGNLDAYAVLHLAETVIDWEEDESGELQFVVTHSQVSKRLSLSTGRDLVTERFCVYTSQGWAIYEMEHKRNELPDKEKPISLKSQGNHSFGRVPWCRLDVGDGLWAMDNIECMARRHFNAESERQWGIRQSLLPDLYEFNGPEEAAPGEVIGENQTDPNRATKDTRGPGYVQKRGDKDRAQYVGPDSAPFVEARLSVNDLRTELCRVTNQLALSQDNSAAALRRSADSKGQDKASAIVVCAALGALARKFAEDLTNMVSRGRGEANLVGQWQASGMAKFDAISFDATIDRAVKIALLDIPSPTFHKINDLAIAREALADEASPEDLDKIERELEKNVTDESLASKKKPGGLFGLPEVTDDEEQTRIKAAKETPPEEQPGTAHKGEEKTA